MSAFSRRHWAGAIAAGALTVIGVAGFGAGAQAAGAFHNCGNRAVTVELSSGTVPPEIHKYALHAKNVKVKGTSCSAATKFIRLLYNNQTATTPEHFKCVNGKFKEPAGFLPELCTRGRIKIEFGHQGG